MSKNYIFTYANSSFSQTKSFELLIQSLKSSHKNTGLVVNTLFEKNNIENLLSTYLKDVTSTPNIFYLSEIIDLQYRLNYSKYELTLDHCFKTFLFLNKQGDLSKLLYQSKTLRKDFLKSYFLSDNNSTNQLELDILKINDVNTSCYKLISKFNLYLNQNLNLTKKSFYKDLKKHPCLSQINHVFFINSHIENTFTKNQIKRLYKHYQSFTWIINKKQEKTIGWIESICNQTQVINETSKHPPLTVSSYSTLSEEINACSNLIYDSINKFPTQTISIIIPEQNDYKQTLENELIKLNSSLNIRYNMPHKKLKLKSFFIACLEFIKRPFSIESLLILSSNSYCKSIKIDSPTTEELMFNIYELILIKQSHQELFNSKTFDLTHINDKKNLEILTSFDSDKQEKLQLVLQTQNVLYKNLTTFKNLNQWLFTFQQFINQFTDFLELKNEKKFTKDIKSILEIIGTRLLLFEKTSNNITEKTLILDSLRESVESFYPLKPSYKAQINLYSINQARYLSHENCFVLGFCNSLYKPKKTNSIFEDILGNNQEQSDVSRKVFQENVLLELSNLSQNLTITMSNLINEEIQLPSVAENIKIENKQLSNKKSSYIPTPIQENHRNLDKNERIYVDSLSASQLDTYNTCPYKFWLEYIVKLNSLKAEKEEISASHWGTFVHSILNDFNIWLLNQKEFLKEKCMIKITDIAHKNFEKLHQKNTFWKTKFESLLSTSSKTGILEQIIDIYSSISYLNNLQTTEKKYSTSIENVTIKGTIDAIFKTLFGDLVLDYKTGKSIPTAKDIELLRSLQLPIYFLCLSKTKNSLPQAGAFFQIYNKDTTQIHLKTCTKDIKEEYLKKTKQRPFLYDAMFIEKVESHIKKLVHLIKTNYFSTQYNDVIEHTYKNRKKLCQFCNYKITCRYPERMSL